MTISDTAREQVFGQEGGGFLVRVLIDHPDLVAPWRFVNNTENIVSEGEDWIAYPFKVRFPRQSSGSPPRASIQIDNVTTEIAELLRGIVEPPTIAITVIRIDDLDAVEETLPIFELVNVHVNGLSVVGDLVIDDLDNEVYPQRTFTPSEYPGLFAALN